MNSNSLSSLMIALYVFMLWGAYAATDALRQRLEKLPVEGLQHAARPASITPNTKIYPLLAETKERTQNMEASNLDTAFTRALAPEPVAADNEKPHPSAADIFKQNAYLSAVADQGAFINGRYYQVGEKINSLATLHHIQACSVQIKVEKEIVTLTRPGNCKG